MKYKRYWLEIGKDLKLRSILECNFFLTINIIKILMFNLFKLFISWHEENNSIFNKLVSSTILII